MRRMKRYLALAAALACLLSLDACRPEELKTCFTSDQPAPDGEGNWAEISLTLAPAMSEAGTKASLLKDVETRGSGALVLVFRSDTRQLATSHFYTQSELDKQASVPLRLNVPLVKCDFYILGNLNAIRKSDGKAFNLQEALGASFPVEESALEAMVYRLDGGDLGGGFRRETFTDVASCGIPYALINKNIETVNLVGSSQGIPGADKCTRLFSKVTISINHGAFDGGGAHPEFFVNSHLYLRQANARLQPFSENPQKAAEAADVLVQSDYDPDMQAANASVTTFSFYVPENMQGSLLSGNTDSRRKTREELISRKLGAVEPYLTYVEFCGHLDPTAGGYGGDVTYRFYLGDDNCSNFDLKRGKEYKVSLSFKVGSIFDSDWRVEPSLTDSRTFALTADASFATDIGAVNDSRLVAVRKSRPGAFYVYMNPLGSLGGTNLLLGKNASTSTSFTPTSLSDCSWYGAFLQSGTEDAAWLAAHGISASWDKASGKLSFRVTDAAKFEARMGDAARTFTLRLLPGGTITTNFRLGLYDDLKVSVAGGKSLTDEFYLGQKRTVTVSGFAGSTVKYAAVQPDCGGKSGNRMWKASSSSSAAFPGCARDAAGHPVLDVRASAYGAQTYLGSLDIYAFFPNRFQSSHGWESRSGKIIFFTEDWLNDSLELDLWISEPQLKTANEYSNVKRLPLDGTPVALADYGYRNFSGTAPMSESDFDATLYTSLLAFRPSVTSGFSDCVGIDVPNKQVYCSDSQSSTYGDLAAKTFSDKGIVCHDGASLIGSMFVYPNYTTGLWKASVYQSRFYFTAPVLTSIQADGSNWNTGSESTVTVNYFNPEVNQYEDDESFWINAKYFFTNSDLSSLNIAPVGNKTTYTVGSTTYGPVYEVQASSYDTGSGGEIRWVYDESKQAKQAPSGAKIPGGLLLPYGEQRMYFTFTNRHSGREVTVDSGKYVTLQYSTDFAYFVGATNQRYAQVFLVPAKNVKYLKRCASTADLDQRTWMTTLFGHRTWSDNAKVWRAYPYVDMGIAAYHNTYTTKNPGKLPLTNFDARYNPGAGSSATKWIYSYMYYLDEQIPTNGYRTPFQPSGRFSDFMIELYDNKVESLGVGLKGDRIDLYGIDETSGKPIPWITNGSVYGAVHGYFISTNQSFARINL